MFMSAISTVWPKIYDQTLFTFAMFAESRLEGTIIMQLFPFRLRPRQGKVIQAKKAYNTIVNCNTTFILVPNKSYHIYNLRVIFKLKMTMGLLLRAALLIMVGLVVMEMASSGMSNSEQSKGKYIC